ncbi:hypothetical protein HanIR_Chr05g0240791 [Helianthus annuus]|nr:hypothetical protein HanIR_Chr05g0240791 [Helianthus annuus]
MCIYLLTFYNKILSGCNEIYPDELNSLVGKKIAFKIEVSKYNVDNKYKSFGNSKITDDVAIVSTLEKNFIDQQMLKKSTEKSQIVDDQTCQPISTNAGTKRNLDYIYDDDETGSTSTKKPDAGLNAAEEGDGKKKLKTPKIEK